MAELRELNYETSGEYLPIQGTYTLNTRIAYGVQEMRLEMTNGVPTKVLTNNQIRFRGDGTYVDTGIAIDGSQTDFTMMLGFTLPEDIIENQLQYIAWGQAGANRLQLRHDSISPRNVLSTQIGQYYQNITFDETKPIHAMVAVFNHTTSQLQVAIDGEPLSAPFDIVFDGPTSSVLFGALNETGLDSLKGYIGEGILSATMESEDAWFVFWDAIQLGECDKNKPAGEYLSNHTFDCGTLGWGFDPAYTAEITDNGDGSLHLKTTSNFGSLIPVKLPTESAEWICEVKIINQTGNGKISFRKPNNVWVSTPTIGDGIHSATYTGVIKELHVGADGDNSYEADYEYISIRKTNSNIVTYLGDTVTYNEGVITHA